MGPMTTTNYRRIWERHTGLKIPPRWHIHHLDGNSANNSAENLNCVSPTMHWWAHYLRGDPVALQGKFIQGAAKAGQLGGQRCIELGKIGFTKEAQAKGRRNRDPLEHRQTSQRAGLKNVASGLLARIRIPWTSETAADAARIMGLRNRGKVWVTSKDQDRLVTEETSRELLSTGEWKLGRSKGGVGSWSDPEKARAFHSAGGKSAMAKRWRHL